MKQQSFISTRQTKKQSYNKQFADLIPLYPEETRFDSAEAAEAAGWIKIRKDKSVHHHRGVNLRCRNGLPGQSFGYLIDDSRDRQVYARSSEVTIGRYISVRFRSGDILAAINVFTRRVDDALNGLITQAEAAGIYAELTGNKRLVQAIYQAIDHGKLTPVEHPLNPDYGQLVKRSEVHELWGY